MQGFKNTTSLALSLAPKDACLCGSGKLYGECCRGKYFELVEDPIEDPHGDLSKPHYSIVEYQSVEVIAVVLYYSEAVFSRCKRVTWCSLKCMEEKRWRRD